MDNDTLEREQPDAPAQKEASPSAPLDIVQFILDMLADSDLPEPAQLSDSVWENVLFQKLYNQVLDLRELSSSLNRGELQKFVYSRGFILSNLKALQANLRHLTWQSKMIAAGDFSQVVDFLGEFSDSFNTMTRKLREGTQQLQRLASIDALTQVPNRLSLDAFLCDAFSSAREARAPLSVILFDLDHFKRINDSHGHLTGDRVLFFIAETISGQFRANDMFARYGGEEFMAVLPNTTTQSALKIAERALQIVADAPLKIDEDLSLSVTVSAGVSSLLPGDGSYEDLVRRSDAALYRAKREGRNCVRTQQTPALPEQKASQS